MPELTVVEITPPTASDSRPLAIAAQMEKWARSYVALLAPVGVAVRSIDSGDSSREACNAFLTAVYISSTTPRFMQVPTASEGSSRLRDTHVTEPQP